MFVNLFPISMVYTEKRKLRGKSGGISRGPRREEARHGALRNVGPLQS